MWLDETDIAGDILREMTLNIDHSLIYLAFISRPYISKLCGTEDTNCAHEFSYASVRKGAKMILPIIMDEIPAVWPGPVEFLRTRLNCCLIEDPIPEANIDQLVASIGHIIQSAHDHRSNTTADQVLTGAPPTSLELAVTGHLGASSNRIEIELATDASGVLFYSKSLVFFSPYFIQWCFNVARYVLVLY